MSEKLKIIPLGGLNEIGKNMTAYEYGNDILVVDCGMGFPDDEMYGIDMVIPDITYLEENADRVRAIVLTHGHEDHIGAVPYVMCDIHCPIYATRLTAGLVELKLAEHNLLDKVEMHTLEAGESFKAGCFKVEFIHVNHSIADSVALAIKTPLGVCIHTGDYKIDPTPIDGDIIDLGRFGTLGKQGVLALLADSTNVERSGYSVSEKKLEASFDSLFKDCKKRIIVTTFASNVHRIQQIINVAAKYGRKVAVTGRSMENIMKVSTELGYMQLPENTLIDITMIKNQPPEKTVIVTTGSQGESMSALYRMAFSGHKQVEITAQDRIIISASAVPGNEGSVSRIIDELFRKGAEVIYNQLSELHVSGHACQEEQKIMLALTKPRYFIPVHGETRHLKIHARLAKDMGMKENNIIIAENGSVIEISRRNAKITGTVQAGPLLVDGASVGDIGGVVLRDRKHLAEDGMLVIVLGLSSEDGSILSGPDIITRGFVYVKESEELMDQLKELSVLSLEKCYDNNITDWPSIKTHIKQDISNYLYKTTKRNPMVLPVIMEI